MRTDNQKSMVTNRDYELIVWRFMNQTRVIMNPVDALGLLGSFLYLRKRHIITDVSSLHNILESDQKGYDNDKSLSVAYSFLLSCYGNLKVVPSNSDFLPKLQDTIQTILSLQENTYSMLFETALEMVAKSSGKQGGEFYQPKEVAKLVAKLVSGSHNNIYNPFSGTASYAEAMNNYGHFYGVELNDTVYKLSILRLAISDKLDKATIEEGDARNWTHNKYNVIVSTPPFAARIEMSDKADGEREFSDTVALSRFEGTTTDDGQLCTIVRTSIIWSADNNIMDVRKDIVEKGFVEKVIMLPANIYYGTAIPLAIIYLNKGNVHPNSVELIDGTDCFITEGPKNVLDVVSVEKRIFHDDDHKLIVPISTIRDNMYALDYQRYKDLSDMEVPEGYEVHKLGELVSVIQPIRSFSETSGNIVTISSISNDPYDCMKMPNDFPKNGNLELATKLTQPALVVSMIRTPKCCYIDASEDNPIFLKSNVRAFRVNLNVVTPEYLCLQLSNQNVPTTGIAIPHITLPMLLSIRIVLPPLEAQNHIFVERKQEDKLAKARELGLQDVIDKMKTDYINDVRMRKHDMRQYLRDVFDGEELLSFLISQKKEHDSVDDEMKIVISNTHSALNNLSKLLEELSNEEEFGTPELINIDEYLMNSPELSDREASNGQPGYEVDYDCDDNALRDAGLPFHKDEITHGGLKDIMSSISEQLRKPYDAVGLFVNIAPLDLDRIVKNIVGNSVKHGFSTKDADSYNNIFVTLSVESHNGNNMFVIDFSDNGKPLPKKMDKQRYGIRGEKAGATAGTGLGGNIVKRMVEHYGGDYDIFSNGEGTTVRIWLPIAKNIEE